jgi:orotate phosphoribosyltransferase-like protein
MSERIVKRRGAAPIEGRTILRAIELRKQGLTQMEIAVELALAQGTISVMLREHGMGGKLSRMSRAERRRLP